MSRYVEVEYNSGLPHFLDGLFKSLTTGVRYIMLPRFLRQLIFLETFFLVVKCI